MRRTCGTGTPREGSPRTPRETRRPRRRKRAGGEFDLFFPSSSSFDLFFPLFPLSFRAPFFFYRSAPFLPASIRTKLTAHAGGRFTWEASPPRSRRGGPTTSPRSLTRPRPRRKKKKRKQRKSSETLRFPLLFPPSLLLPMLLLLSLLLSCPLRRRRRSRTKKKREEKRKRGGRGARPLSRLPSSTSHAPTTRARDRSWRWPEGGGRPWWRV